MTQLSLDTRATRDAYDAAAKTYAEFFKGALARKPFDRAMLQTFAELVGSAGGGRVADLGCGPGMGTGYLHTLGMDVFGVDISSAMLALARQAHPGIPFAEGSIEALPLSDGSLAGVVASYSIIHASPTRIPPLFAEFSRVLRPGGYLLLIFQGADSPTNDVQPFDHAITAAYRYSAEYVFELLTHGGTDEVARLIRQPDEEERFKQVCIIATKPR